MATVEQRDKRFRLIFYFSGQRYAASLKTTSRCPMGLTSSLSSCPVAGKRRSPNRRPFAPWPN
jgi:hypothetical protein